MHSLNGIVTSFNALSIASNQLHNYLQKYSVMTALMSNVILVEVNVS